MNQEQVDQIVNEIPMPLRKTAKLSLIDDITAITKQFKSSQQGNQKIEPKSGAKSFYAKLQELKSKKSQIKEETK